MHVTTFQYMSFQPQLVIQLQLLILLSNDDFMYASYMSVY